MRLIRGWFAIPLWQRVVGGLLLGIALGLFRPEAAGAIRLVGELFVRLIKMLVVPVVLVTIAGGIATLGDPRRLGSIGLRTVGLFAVTTLVAVSIGMAMGLALLWQSRGTGGIVVDSGGMKMLTGTMRDGCEG
ncbi:cation:dicarboxylate symporter family transporter [Sphingomonas sp. SORGH_AS_0879]|uniref:cation:dicarboxylate symporter family transporter n=1 Tax=Sphingomonas sp. SORGH_AS_0879 TaxID=3041790 RepID=UPI0027817525|nr:cation:dicarboxylase symporter family transporter [Sphingomonas sp. SORGH_AS_0879]MDQ1231169.1 Na+/H+-dicarboxylate symporter [Sphingomonas sp. SORGH_AS_0879]